MKLSELMAGRIPNPDFEGFVTNDDYVLAVDCSVDGKAAVGDYAVVQMGVAGLDAQLNPVTQDKQYIRAGQSTTKTGNQRSFAVSGDRYVGDAFLDFAMSHSIKYGTGNSVIRPYVYFCVLNGKGEQGKVSIIVNSDGSGDAGGNSEIDIELKKAGEAPAEYTYGALDNADLSALTYKIATGSAVAVEGFKPAITNYNVVLPFGTSATAAMTLQGTLSDSGATVAVNAGVTLVAGAGIATITVKARNGTTTKTYTINFTTATA